MPLGGLGKGLQNSINSWVNVNSNHVVFPKGGDSSQQQQHSSHSDDVSHSNSSSSSVKGRMMNRVVNQTQRDQLQKHNFTSNSTMGSTRTGNSTSSISTQLGSIIEKSNQQQQPRKLTRSNSQSDLIKEKLAKREQQQRNMTHRSSALSHRSSMESMVSRRGSMESVASNSSAPVNTGQYVNEIAFKRQLAAQQQLQQQGGSSQISLMSKNSLTKKTSPNRSHTSSAPPPSNPRSNSPGLNSFKNVERRSSAPNINMSRIVQSQNISSGASVASVNSSTIMTTATAPSLIQNLPVGCEHTDCDHCIHLSQRIFALEEDLEALRGNYLNTEYICKSCTRNNKNMSSGASVASGRTANSRSSRHSMGTKTTRKSQGSISMSLSENVVLAEASRRLILLTSRHKRDIERLSKEKERFQKDMHFKLKNFTMMFKDVEKESLGFKDQVEKVNKDVTVVKGERDALSSELEILKARVAMYEKQEAENEEIRRLLRENQNETLDIADRAIHERDVIIEELTARLQEATILLQSKET